MSGGILLPARHFFETVFLKSMGVQKMLLFGEKIGVQVSKHILNFSKG